MLLVAVENSLNTFSQVRLHNPPLHTWSFFLVSFFDHEQWLWTGATASAGIWVSLWENGPIGKTSVVQETRSSVKLSWKIKSMGEKNTTVHIQRRKEGARSYHEAVGLHVEVAPILVVFWQHSLVEDRNSSVWARDSQLPQISTLSAPQPNSPIKPLETLLMQFPLYSSCTKCSAQAELGHP